MAHRLVQNGELLFYAAVEFPMVLVPAAGGEHEAIRKLLQKFRDGLRSGAGVIQKIQPKFQKRLSDAGLSSGMIQQRRNIRKTKGNADARKRFGGSHGSQGLTGYHGV